MKPMTLVPDAGISLLVGETPARVQFNIVASVYVYDTPPLDEATFYGLVDAWRDERNGFSSSLGEILACPSHLRIVARGWSAIPHIIKHLRENPDDPEHWGPALSAISEENPVPMEAAGDSVKIASAWLGWYDQKHNPTRRIPAPKPPEPQGY